MTADRRNVLALRVALVVVAATIVVAVARLASLAWTHEVSFDGAMNLEVARSLAEGDGYRRMYADRTGFSHEIQSRAPYIVPAAAVFAAFGVGIWQSQLTNLLYVVALSAFVFLLVRRATSWRWALAALAASLWMPGIREVAMNGYGEVPALVWWFAAVLVLCPPADARVGNARLFAAGVLLGMAVLTKTVLAIGLVAIVPLVVAAFVGRGARPGSIFAGLFALALGIVLPVIGYELAHVAMIGDVGRWRAWLHEEIRAIHMQAGTAEGFHDTNGVGAKLLVHSRLLADSIGLPVALLPFWIAGPIVLAFIGRRWLPSPSVRAAMLTLSVFAAIYCLWWLGFTPTEKAWFRRIYNGVFVLEILLVVMLGALWRFGRRGPNARAIIAMAIAIVALQLPVLWAEITDDASDFATADSLREDMAALQKVPPHAEVYGASWYSAPVLALYSGRHFGNIATRTPAELAASAPVYLVLDPPALQAGTAQYWLDRYAHRDLARTERLNIVEIDANRPVNPFEKIAIDDAAVLGEADFHRGDYPYVFGFQNREGDGWRWATADTAVLLRYDGEASLFIDIYLPPLGGYRFKRDVGITAWIGACSLGTVRQDESRRERWFLPTRNCPLAPGSRVTVRLTSDNLYESRDDRQLGYIVRAIGFAGTANGAADQR